MAEPTVKDRSYWMPRGARRRRGVVCDLFGHKWRVYGVFGSLRKCRRCWQRQERTNEYEISNLTFSHLDDGTVRVVDGVPVFDFTARRFAPADPGPTEETP